MLYSCTSLYLIYPERVCVIYNTGTYYVLNDIVYLSPLLQIFFSSPLYWIVNTVKYKARPIAHL